jgi:hypothetical protein
MDEKVEEGTKGGQKGERNGALDSISCPPETVII